MSVTPGPVDTHLSFSLSLTHIWGYIPFLAMPELCQVCQPESVTLWAFSRSVMTYTLLIYDSPYPSISHVALLPEVANGYPKWQLTPNSTDGLMLSLSPRCLFCQWYRVGTERWCFVWLYRKVEKWDAAPFLSLSFSTAPVAFSAHLRKSLESCGKSARLIFSPPAQAVKEGEACVRRREGNPWLPRFSSLSETESARCTV